MYLAALIASYGYIAVFLGSIFEGETILVLGGLASHEGYLNLFWVFVVAFLGAIVGDLSLFLLGRYKGHKVIGRYPSFKKLLVRPRALIEKHQTLIAFGMRFMYGFRHVTPFALGMSSIKTRMFILCNIVSSLIWAFGIGMIGYLFGDVLQALLGRLRHYEFRVIFFTALFFGVGYCFHKLVRYIIYKANKE